MLSHAERSVYLSAHQRRRGNILTEVLKQYRRVSSQHLGIVFGNADVVNEDLAFCWFLKECQKTNKSSFAYNVNLL